MLTVAYLANMFPSPVEPYVGEEIEELRKRGVRVIAGSARKNAKGNSWCSPEIVLQEMSAAVLAWAAWLCVSKCIRIWPLLRRVIFQGNESPIQRAKALVHTLLGACYAILLQEHEVDHIHVHHGYFGSWVAMTAAKLLDVPFSMTLHGSDLLLHAVYLDVKLANCAFCLTVSEYNRRHILEKYPEIDSSKILVSRLGVEAERPNKVIACTAQPRQAEFTLLTAGRLHAVKNHSFLLRACAALRDSGIDFECMIAGDGPKWGELESLIREERLESRVMLMGHVARERMDSLYDCADIVVLTSRSEGIPIVLMEAMARGKIVLAPAITGIPELVIHHKTGFLYKPESLPDFVAQLLLIRSLMQIADRSHPHIPLASRKLGWIRHAAWAHVCHNFNRKKNLEIFGDLFLLRAMPRTESLPHEDFVLQQI